MMVQSRLLSIFKIMQAESLGLKDPAKVAYIYSHLKIIVIVFVTSVVLGVEFTETLKRLKQC